MKIIVAHPAQQHSYRLATGLKINGAQVVYATTVYNKNRSLTAKLSAFLSRNDRSRAEGRRCDYLQDDEVIQFCEAEGLLKLLVSRIPNANKLYIKIKYHVADRFAKKVARYAIKNNADAVITYDDSSPILFEILKEKAPRIIRILDVSAVNREYMRSIYEKDFELQPRYADLLRQECLPVWDVKLSKRLQKEMALSDFFLSPSEFVSESLMYSKIQKRKIIYLPYGVDISMFESSNKGEEPQLPIRFIYVGGYKELKGISYLLEAFSHISSTLAILTVVGKHENDINQYTILDNVQYTGVVLHSEIPKILHDSDVFVFPSLGDSFGLSVLEAASCGLPLIVSKNAGISDHVVDGVEGFVIEAQSVESIYNKVMWFVEHRKSIKKMGLNAKRMAEGLTWERYYSQCNCIIETVRKELDHNG